MTYLVGDGSPWDFDALLDNRRLLYYRLVNADYYVDPAHASASDLNDGRSEAFPFATLTQAVAAVGASANKTIAIKRGSVLRPAPAPTSSIGLTIRDYGSASADDPRLYGSNPVLAASLTALGSGVYSSPLAYDPRTLALVSPTGVITKLYQAAISIGQTAVTSGTTAADPSIAGEWLWNGTDTIKFKLPAAVADITGYTLEVPVNNLGVTGAGITANGSGTTIQNIVSYFWTTAGFVLEGTNCKVIGGAASYNAYDGIDVGWQATGFLVDTVKMNYNGPRFGSISGPGDGFSAHDNGGANVGPTGVVTRCQFVGNTLTGSGNQSGAKVQHSYCYFEDNLADAFNYASSSAPGYNNFDYCIFAHKVRATPWFNQAANVNITQGSTFRNCTIYYAPSLPTGSMLPYSANLGGGTYVFDNLIFRAETTYANFAQYTAAGSIAVRNLTVSGATTRWRPGFGTTVTETGALSTDPLLVNPVAGNFALRPTSPAIASGVNIGLTTDYYGTPVPATPDRGAVQRR